MGTPTVPAEKTSCPFCGIQCGMTVANGETLPHPEGSRLCVLGLSAGVLIRHPERLTTPLVRKNGRLVPSSWEEALTVAAEGFLRIARTWGPKANAVFGSGSLTNEKAYLLGKLARLALRTPHVDYNGRYCMSAAAMAQNLAFGLDRGLNRPLADLAQHDLILLAGSNAAESLPMLVPHLMAAKRGGTRLIVVDPRHTLTAKLADLHLALRPGTDLALANALFHAVPKNQAFIKKHTRGFEEALKAVEGSTLAWAAEVCGLEIEALEKAVGLLSRAQRPLILTGRGADQNTRGVRTTLAYINLALGLGGEFGTLTGQANGQGGREMGQKSDQLPGYRSIEDPADRAAVARVWGVPPELLPGRGKSAFEILEAIDQGEIRGLLVLGSNPAASSPQSDRIRSTLAQMEHLVVIDPFLSETASLAQVVLPGSLWAEEGGTTTNLEGQVVLRRAVQDPPIGARRDWEILVDLAHRLGAGAHFRYSNLEDIYNELRQATQGAKADYFGITYERLERGDALFWPCPHPNHSGTPRPFAQRFAHPDGKARFFPTPYAPPAEVADAEFPLLLTTGRVLYHYLTGNLTRRIERLNKKCPGPWLEVHPATATRLGLTEGQPCEVRSRRAWARYTVRLNARIRPDTVFVPFHWEGSSGVNRLTNPTLDPFCGMPEFKLAAVNLTPIE